MKRRISLLLAVLLVITMLPAQASAVVKNVGTPVETDTLISSENLEHNFVKVTADGDTLNIEVETPIQADQFSISVRGVKPATSTNDWCRYVTPTDMGGYYRFETSLGLYAKQNGKEKLADGTYVLCITMPPKTSGNRSDMFYKNCNFKLENGKFTILKYNKIVKENARLEKNASSIKPKNCKKTNLSDYKNLFFKDPVTKKVASVTTKKVKYFKRVSDAVTKGASSDYEKLRKIYEYIGENFYYDDIAFKTGTKQYVDPYRNLYNLRNQKKSANSQDGKVATTCVGYSAAVVALARAQGIPARVVNGHHVAMGTDRYYNWSNEEDITKIDHWWAECYVDGRWITVDATTANSNKWNRSTKTWNYTGLTNYIYFDPTPEQLATSHVVLTIKGTK